MTRSARLSTLCQFRSGGTPSKTNLAFWNGDIPWVSPKDMNGSLLTDSIDHISSDAVSGSATSVVPPGSILIVVRSGILVHSLPIARATRPVAFNQDIKALMPDTTKVDPDYLYWFLRGCERAVLARGVKKGATVHSVQSGFIESLEIPLPEREEQRCIVDFLSRAEGIVRLRREAQKKAADLLPAIFHDMFGDPTTNPKGWSTTLLGTLIKNGPQNGLYKHASLYGEGTPILRIDGFYNGRITGLESLKRVRIDAEEREKYRLRSNDIIINRVNSPEYLAKSALVPPLIEDIVFESNMMRFSVDQLRVSARYLTALLQTSYARSHFLSRAKHAINQSSVNQQDVKALSVALPPLPRQQAFGRRCDEHGDLASQMALASGKARDAFGALLARTFA